MVSLTSLWMPILLAAVAVFVLSAIVHMVLPYHRGDMARLPGEDDVMAALRSATPAAGDYVFPYAESMASMKDPAYVEKLKRGPAGLLTILPPLRTERPSMTAELIQWFIFALVVSLFAGYIASRALGPGESAGEVLRFTGTVAFVAYGLGAVPSSIWSKRQWSTTLKTMFDGLLYALATGAVFLWMWP